MPNQWFRFKQFLVRQEKSAMKVCTDACLFGALVSNKIGQEKWDVKQVLDVGTGTGLLSLMVAQKSRTQIDAVEIDTAAALEATENVANAGFQHNIRVIPGDITQIELPSHYDLVICNPPFFKNHLKSKDQKRNLALHTEALSFAQLTAVVVHVLRDTGNFAVLLPYDLTTAFIATAANAHLFLSEQVFVKQSGQHSYFRSILFFKKVKTALKTSELAIKEGDHYSAEFIELLKDYYLNL